MISKQNIELVRSLSQKKRRDETGLFVAEGEKIVLDLLKTRLTLSTLYITVEGAALLKNFSNPEKNYSDFSKGDGSGSPPSKHPPAYWHCSKFHLTRKLILVSFEGS